jgi:hypothetical protein
MINPALSFQNDWNPHFAIYPAAQMYCGTLLYGPMRRFTGNRRISAPFTKAAIVQLLISLRVCFQRRLK